jgi:formylglycine-generating enzyme required for sulfatase activity
MMWSTPGPHTEPGHLVHVESFLLSRYEVTQKHYEAIMGSNPSYFKGNPDLPVEQVSSQDCQEFIKRLNALEGKEVYRLPTEAEWEYACLADSGNDYGFCSTNDDPIEYAWYETNSGGRTHPVGQLKMNPWGLYDIHGNVWEWCQDWHGQHPSLSLTGPEGFTAAFRIVRGGAWDSPEGNCRAHTRRSYSPAKERLNTIGFRLAKTISIRTKAQEN